MRIGVPREVKAEEGRVALVPEACREFVRRGHQVFVQARAGEKSGFPDTAYREAGAELVESAAAVYESAELIIKVKEPQPEELEFLHADHLLFCFLHLAAFPELTERLQEIGLTAIGFETVEEDGRLPLLAPMSQVAGTLAAHIGTNLLHQPAGGSGVLLGGIPGTSRGRVVVLGAGEAGSSAIGQAAALGAEVTVFDLKLEKLAAMRQLGANVSALYPYEDAVADAVTHADLVVGAVLVPGARAPVVVPESLVKQMPAGSAIMDISIDQGGCVETSRPTTYDKPTYERHGVTHFAVTNMPGAVPRTATQALSAAITRWALQLTEKGWRDNPGLRAGINIEAGELILPELKV